TLPVYAIEVLAADRLVAPVVRAVGAAGCEAWVVEERRPEARRGPQVHKVRGLWRLKCPVALAVADLRLVALEVGSDGHDVAAARGRPDRSAEKLHVARPVPERAWIPVHAGDEARGRTGHVVVADDVRAVESDVVPRGEVAGESCGRLIHLVRVPGRSLDRETLVLVAARVLLVGRWNEATVETRRAVGS